MADLRDVYYAHMRPVSLGKLEGQRWDVRLCDGGMELRNRDGDLFADAEKVSNVYLVGLNVISPRTALATCTMDGDDAGPTHDELVERPDKVALVATAKSRRHKSVTVEDCRCISRERDERYGDYGPTGEDMRALRGYTSCIRKGAVAQKNTSIEYASTSPGQCR